MARRPVLTKTEIKHIAEELDTSRGYLPHLVKEKPWLIDMSRQYLCNLGFCGDKFPVFRSVALMHMAVSPGEYVAPHIQLQVDAASALRPESVVSTSLNPSTVITIAAQQAEKMYFTGGFLRGGLITTKPVILRYDVTVDRVVLYIPALIAFIRSIYSTEELKKTRYRSRSGVCIRYRTSSVNWSGGRRKKLSPTSPT